MKLCSVLVNSCDKFADTWNPFFSLFNYYWKQCPYDIFLNTEELNYEFDKLNIDVLNHKSSIPWSDRLIDTLKKIKTKYIIFLLDDFFFNDYVDQNKIEKCISWLENDKNIAVFSFYNSKWVDIDDKLHDGFELRPLYGEYRFNTQAAIWRRDILLKLLIKNESPWDAENWGTFRARVLMPKMKFYAAKKNEKKIISYEYGGAIHRGMWTNNTPNLLQSHGITGIDYCIRGFDKRPTSDWEKLCLDEKIVIPKKNIKIKIAEYLIAKDIIKHKRN